jgi:hypothetical protein
LPIAECRLASRAAGDIDPDFLEHLRREQEAEQMELPWD